MSDLGDHLNEWSDLQQASERADTKPTLFTAKFDEDKINLWLVGDMHIGSRFFDEDLLKRTLETIFENDDSIILMGDQIEHATRHSVGAGVYEQTEIVQQQYEHFLHLFKPLAEAGLILGLHPGNHEFRGYKDTGLDIAKNMARELKVPYFGWGKHSYIRVGKEGYTIYTTHGSSGARLPHTKIKGAIDLAHLANAEIYAMGHVHQLSHHVRTFYDVNLRAKKIVEGQKHFILSGSFLNHWGSYGHMKNYEPMRKGSPKIGLFGDRHEIRVSL